MSLAPDVLDLVRIGQLFEAAEAEADGALDALRRAEASGIGDLPVLEARQQFTNGRAEGLAQALEVLTGRPAALHRLGAIQRINEFGSRPLSAGRAGPENPAAVV